MAAIAAMFLVAAFPAVADEVPVLPPTRPADAVPAARSVPALTRLPAQPSGGRDLYRPLLEREARSRGLPPEVADAVTRVESSYDPSVVGGAGERGLMQVMPPTAAMLGFRGSVTELADPAINIRYGVQYLADAWRRSGGDLCRALMKYRAGHNEERMSPLSVEYCRRAKSHLASIGSPLAAGVLPSADFFPSGRVATAGAGIKGRVAGRSFARSIARTAATRNRFWLAHSARIRAIEARLPWKRGGIMTPG